MKENEKQAIEEMARDLCACYVDHTSTFAPKATAEKMTAKGYRKQSEVIDEFVKMLKEKMNNLSRMEYHCDPYFLVSEAFIDEIAEEMKGGAE